MSPRLDFSKQVIRAIRAEIQTARTFLLVALSSRQASKKTRTAANAWKAYNTARAWAEKEELSPTELKEIAGELENLKADLTRLEVPGTLPR